MAFATGQKVTVKLNTVNGGFNFVALDTTPFQYDPSATGSFNNPAAIPSNQSGYVNVTPPGNSTIGEGAIVCHLIVDDFSAGHVDEYFVDILYTASVIPNLATQLISIIALAEEAVQTAIAATYSSPQGAAAIGGIEGTTTTGVSLTAPSVMVSATLIGSNKTVTL